MRWRGVNQARGFTHETQVIHDDYNYIMDFLREMCLQTGTQHCWLPQRWEYAEHICRYLNIERGEGDWQKHIGIWEQDGRIGRLCNGEEGINDYLQVCPGYEPD